MPVRYWARRPAIALPMVRIGRIRAQVRNIRRYARKFGTKRMRRAHQVQIEVESWFRIGEGKHVIDTCKTASQLPQLGLHLQHHDGPHRLEGCSVAGKLDGVARALSARSRRVLPVSS